MEDFDSVDVDMEGAPIDDGFDPTSIAEEPQPEPAPSSPEGNSARNALFDRLTNSNPDPPLESISEFDSDTSTQRLIRGLRKFAGADGASSAEDIVLGLLGLAISQTGGADTGGADDSSDAEPSSEEIQEVQL